MNQKERFIIIMELAEKYGIDVVDALTFCLFEGYVNNYVARGGQKWFDFVTELNKILGMPLTQEQEEMYKQRVKDVIDKYNAEGGGEKSE